ncbi:MAG TPA: NADH-quinone oxidoreductase subunit L [Chryseosolibacter sp.]
METSYFHNDGFLMLCLFLTLFLPLLSSFFSFSTPDRYSWLIILIAPFLLLLTAVFSLIVIFSCWNNTAGLIRIPWISLSDASISANIFLENTTLLMASVVSVVSFLVHLYSVGYMAGDGNPRKYFGMLGFFTFAMQGIVLADNLLVLFIFWELVGFSSYILIGHWSEKTQAGKAATKAFLFNRVGDAAFLIGLMVIWDTTGTFEISTINTSATFEWQTFAGLCIFGGVIGKSAQFPLFTWLPDAMEGPTPVSALIHAATMVAAGVYLLIRVFPLFSETALMVIAVTGAVTAFAGALAALFQFDIKKVLAYSTISQLGLMILTIGMGGVYAGLLHLFAHAFFKACLFLSAGSVIHSLHQAQRRDQHHFDVQDLRNMGGLRKNLPVTFLTFTISGASLAGIPFFSGFLSKEAMYTALLKDNTTFSLAVFVVMAIVSFLTVLYTFRLIWFIFMDDSRKPSALPVVEVPMIMRIPTALLAASSIWIIVSLNPFNFFGWIVTDRSNAPSIWLTIFSVMWVAVALVMAYMRFRKPSFLPNEFIADAFKIDVAYDFAIKRSSEKLATTVEFSDQRIIDKAIHASAYGHVIFAHVIGWFDKYIVDGLVHFVSSIIRWVGGIARSYQNGKIQDYILYAILALIIFIIWAL